MEIIDNTDESKLNFIIPIHSNILEVTEGTTGAMASNMGEVATDM